MDQTANTTTTAPPKRGRGRPPLPPELRKAGIHLQVRPQVRQEMADLSAELGVPIAQIVEAVWTVALGFARHPEGARLLQDHAAAKNFGAYVAEKVSARQTIVIDGLVDHDGVASGMVDVARHLAAVEGRE